MMKYILCISVACLCLSCGRNDEKVSFPSEVKANVQILKETFMGTPLEMNIYSGNIYVSDLKGDSLLWRFKMDDFTADKLVPNGEGPDESLSPIQYFIGDTILTIHNRWHFSMQQFRYFQQKDTLIPLGDKIRLSTDIDMIHPLSEGRYVASGRFEESRFIVMDGEGNIVSRCGTYPEYLDGEESYPNFPKFMFHQSMFGYNEADRLLAVATGHVLDIWHDVNDFLSLKKRVLLSPYKYTYQSGKDWATAMAEKGIERGTKRIYVTRNRIYLLYDPNTDEEGKKLNSEIWIFDWNGTALKKIQTDYPLTCICVDEEGHHIYCMVNAPEVSIGMIPL